MQQMLTVKQLMLQQLGIDRAWQLPHTTFISNSCTNGVATRVARTQVTHTVAQAQLHVHHCM
jgi:hypothetical protein